jgi:hypothetical protein
LCILLIGSDGPSVIGIDGSSVIEKVKTMSQV